MGRGQKLLQRCANKRLEKGPKGIEKQGANKIWENNVSIQYSLCFSPIGQCPKLTFGIYFGTPKQGADAGPLKKLRGWMILRGGFLEGSAAWPNMRSQSFETDFFALAGIMRLCSA